MMTVFVIALPFYAIVSVICAVQWWLRRRPPH
jgi:hypothetical protein